MLGEEKGTRRDGELVKATSHRLTGLSITSPAETEPIQQWVKGVQGHVR